MRLNLREIVEMPGAEMRFECVVGTGRLNFPSIKGFRTPPAAKGKIKNSAGLLTLSGGLRADMICVCDRCGREFDRVTDISVDATLSAGSQDSENPDVFPLDGDMLDTDNILETVFILNTDVKCLCREDCAGLCGDCGADLNSGPCKCKVKTDPKLAVSARYSDAGEDPE